MPDPNNALETALRECREICGDLNKCQMTRLRAVLIHLVNQSTTKE